MVREPDGVLRTANFQERAKVMQVYFPEEERQLHTPKMFSEENLEVRLVYCPGAGILNLPMLRLLMSKMFSEENREVRVQFRHLIPALNVWAAWHNSRLHARLPPSLYGF